MALLGFLLLFTGIIMNIQILRRLNQLSLTPAQIMRTQPWLISAALIGCGVVLVLVSRV